VQSRAGPGRIAGVVEDVLVQIGEEDLAQLAAAPFSYLEVGATSTNLSPGYRTVQASQQLGSGPTWFEVACERLMTWDMHRRAGLHVSASHQCIEEARWPSWGSGSRVSGSRPPSGWWR
jgi:hypothetical protein